MGLDGYLGLAFDAPIFDSLDQEVSTRVLEEYWILGEGTLAQTGQLEGVVIDALDNSPIQGVRVEVRQGDDVLFSSVTGTDGSFRVTLEVGEGYLVSFSKSGYLPETYTRISVDTERTTFLQPVLQISEELAGPGNISGRIINAFDGSGIVGARVDLRRGINNQNGAVVTSTNSGSSGSYRFLGLDAGNYTAEIIADGFSGGFFTVLCLADRTLENQDGTVSPVLAQGETRIVLTWGATPSDLDSHLFGPTADGQVFHVYFANQNYSDNTTAANLDLDDVTSFGPETTTIERQAPGTYIFAVHDYTNQSDMDSTGLSLSGARVEVYQGAALVASFNVPRNRAGTVWTVFTLDGTNLDPVKYPRQ